jgi:hypothetical protein
MINCATMSGRARNSGRLRRLPLFPILPPFFKQCVAERTHSWGVLLPPVSARRACGGGTQAVSLARQTREVMPVLSRLLVPSRPPVRAPATVTQRPRPRKGGKIVLGRSPPAVAGPRRARPSRPPTSKLSPTAQDHPNLGRRFSWALPVCRWALPGSHFDRLIAPASLGAFNCPDQLPTSVSKAATTANNRSVGQGSKKRIVSLPPNKRKHG